MSNYILKQSKDGTLSTDSLCGKPRTLFDGLDLPPDFWYLQIEDQARLILKNYPCLWNLWNEEWDRQNPGKRLNLGGTKLADSKLKDLNLDRVILTGSDFRGADLRGTHLFGADLRKALTDADLMGAKLN